MGKVKDAANEITEIKDNVEALKDLGYKMINRSKSKWEVEFPTNLTHAYYSTLLASHSPQSMYSSSSINNPLFRLKSRYGNRHFKMFCLMNMNDLYFYLPYLLYRYLGCYRISQLTPAQPNADASRQCNLCVLRAATPTAYGLSCVETDTKRTAVGGQVNR
jgi:hypothetical protein